MRNKYRVDGDIVTIYLTKRSGEIMETVIDTVDFEKANSFPYTWFAHFDPSTGNHYVKGNMMVGKYKQKTIAIHRWLTDTNGKMKVDHINHDTLNNKRSTNLRVVTNSQNLQNRKGATIANTSGIRGVTWNKTAKKWQAIMKVEKKQQFLGYFLDIMEAKKVVEEARSRLMPFSKEFKGVI